MTQQEISRLLDVPDRTLRDWKKNRQRLYQLLERLEYDEAKEKLHAVDANDTIVFDPQLYSQNLFWQTSGKSEQRVYAIISNYLSTLNHHDIQTLCSQFGKSLVRNVLNDKYKKMYAKGYISANGIDIPLKGTYNQNDIYRQIISIINDC